MSSQEGDDAELVAQRDKDEWSEGTPSDANSIAKTTALGRMSKSGLHDQGARRSAGGAALSWSLIKRGSGRGSSVEGALIHDCLYPS